MKVFVKENFIMLLSISLVIFIGYIDYISGANVGFYVLYYIPIAIVGWYFNKNVIYIFSFYTLIVWFISEMYNKHFSYEYVFQNGLLRAYSFVFVLYIIIRIKDYYLIEQTLKEKLQKAQNEIKTLTGILPICASCKKIRNSEGYWEQVEKYIKSHTDAEFTHGICEDCMNKLYPDFVKQTKHKKH